MASVTDKGHPTMGTGDREVSEFDGQKLLDLFAELDDELLLKASVGSAVSSLSAVQPLRFVCPTA